MDIPDLERRATALRSEQASWLAQYWDISQFMIPYNMRYFATDRNKGQDKTHRIYNNTPTLAVKGLAAGMLSGMTPPSRPWFSLSVPDKDLADFQPVKVWLAQVTRMIESVFSQSNLYNQLHANYLELAGFGTSCALVTDSFKNVINVYNFTAGEYQLATDWQGQVCTLYRHFQMQVSQVVKEFGLEA